MRQVERERKEIVELLLSGEYDFPELAVRIFRYQYNHNPLYHSFCKNLGRNSKTIAKLSDIPFLPIRFFKTHEVKTGGFQPQLTFRSSGTTESGRSQHLLYDRKLYERISVSIFEEAYGPLENCVILALLPSYLEQGDSSLVYMVRTFMEESNDVRSRFYHYDFNRLRKDLENFMPGHRKIILWGVTYALLDFAEHFISGDGERLNLKKGLIVLETGGMKGRREELLRSHVHERLNSAFHSEAIHSEYGMTEMLSQAYSTGKGVFRMGRTMKILTYDIMDPLTYIGDGKPGRCHVVDLANVDSCSFLATDDLCCVGGNSFEILGRLDNSDVRGCNLLYQ